MPVEVLAQNRDETEEQRADGEGFDTVNATAIPTNELQHSPFKVEAFSKAFDETKPLNAELLALIDAWPMLTDEAKAHILAMATREVTGDS